MKAPLAILALALSVSPASVRIISSGPSHARLVALTFDAGADRGYGSQILRTLEKDHVHATFGMTGTWAIQNTDLLRRMVRDHDQIMNHTYDHRSFTGLSTRTYALTARQRTWEIQYAAHVIKRLTGYSPRPYFRPPFGDYDAATLSLLGRLGYRYMIMWTVDSLGWDHLPAPLILQRCLTLIQPGAIVVMHVGIQSQDAVALQPLITALKHRGYTFGTVSSLVTER